MRLAAEAVLAMFAAAVFAGALGAAEAPPDPAAETWRLLATPVDVGPESISSEKLFADIQRQVPGLKIEVDPELTSLGYDFNVGRIGFTASRIPVSEALTLALLDRLALEVRPGCVRICHKADSRPELPLVRYPVGRLVAQPLPAGRSYDAYEAWSNITELTAIVMRTVNSMSSSQVAAWSDEGGAAELRWAGSSMVVSQTREGHRRIAELLLGLSRGLGLEYAGPMPERRTGAPAVEEVRRLLARRIDLDFEWVSIEDALDHIRTSCPGVSFVVDPRLVPDGVESEGRLCAKAKGMPIDEALSCCLSPSFGWAARPGYVLITDPDHLFRELPAALYPVRDVLVLRAEGGMAWSSTELIAAIQRNVSSCLDEKVAAWSDEGGPASIEYYRGMLVITQTRRGHEEVDRLLRLVRSAADFAKAQSSRPRAAVPCFAFPEDPQLVATYDALETRMDVDFRDKPVMEAVAAVAERAPRLNVVIENTADLPVRITLKRQGATRQAILEELVGEKAHCEARRGYALFKAEVGKYTRVLLAAYPVGGMNRTQSSDGRTDALERAIESAVNHADDPEVASWMDEGGPASIDSCAGVLLIRQTPQAHRRINALLQELRFRGRAAGPLP